MGDILKFTGNTLVDITADELLDAAKTWNMTKCIVVGVDEDDELCFGGSTSDVPMINWLLDLAKQQLLNDDEFDGQRIQE